MDREPFTLEEPEIYNCRRCSRRVYWVSTLHGKRMPFDIEPQPDGSFFLWFVDTCSPVAMHVRSTRPEMQFAVDHNWPRYTCHTVTCPDAPMMRVGKKGFRR